MAKRFLNAKQRRRKRLLSILKARSRIKTVFSCNYAEVTKEKPVRSGAGNLANNHLFKIYPPHVFMKDLHDFIKACRKQSDEESLQTNSLNCCEEDEYHSASSSEQKAVDFNESTQLDANGTINFSTKSLEEKMPTSFSELCIDHDYSGHENTTSAISNGSCISFSENNEYVLTESSACSTSGVVLSGSAEDELLSEMSPGDCENDSVLEPSDKEYERSCSGIRYLAESSTGQHISMKRKSPFASKNNCHLGHACEAIPRKKPSKDTTVKLQYSEEKFECSEKAIILKTDIEMESNANSLKVNGENFRNILPEQETRHPDIYTHVETESRKNYENSFRLDQRGIYKPMSSKIFYRDLRFKLLMNRSFRSKRPMTDDADIDSSSVKQCKTHHSVSLSHEKKACFELPGEVSVESSNTAEESDCETVECLPGELSVESSSIEEKSDCETVECLPGNVSVESSNIAEEPDCETVECLPGELSVESSTIAEKSNCETVECQGESLLLKDGELSVESSNIAECETVDCHEDSLLPKDPLPKYVPFEANGASKISTSDVHTPTDVLQSETIPCKTLELFNVCSEISKSEVKEAVEYMSQYVPSHQSELFYAWRC